MIGTPRMRLRVYTEMVSDAAGVMVGARGKDGQKNMTILMLGQYKQCGMCVSADRRGRCNGCLVANRFWRESPDVKSGEHLSLGDARVRLELNYATRVGRGLTIP